MPSIDELRRNISLTLVNAHKSTSKPRPLMPGIVYYGGAHIKAPKPLPKDIQEYIDKAEHGVIFFSFGSFVQSSELPKEKIDIFLTALSKVKQRVIWKFEDESHEVPPNVLIRKWLPQSDILAHPNVILFIAHGGMSGTFEGLHRLYSNFKIIAFFTTKNVFFLFRNGSWCADVIHSIFRRSISKRFEMCCHWKCVDARIFHPNN